MQRTINAADISELRKAGESDETILQFYRETNPTINRHAGELQGESPSDVLDFLAHQSQQNPRIIDFEGKRIELPHDATDDEVHQILSSYQPADTSFTSALGHGAANALGGVASTLDVAGNELGTNTGVASAFRSASEAVKPRNYDPAAPKVGLNPMSWGYIPRALVESAPQLATSVAGAAVGGFLGGPVGATAGVVAPYAAQNYGNTVNEIAQAQGHSSPTRDDLVRAGLITGAESLLERFGLRGVGGTALAGGVKNIAMGTAKQALKAGAKEGVANAGQEALHQAGTTLGTQQGLTLDPDRIAGAGVIGAASAGALRAANVTPDIANAIRFRDIDQLSGNRLADRFSGLDIPTNTTARSAQALKQVGVELKSDIGSAKAEARKVLRERDALELAQRITGSQSKGMLATEADVNLLHDRIGDTEQGSRYVDLIRERQALNRLQTKGQFIDSGKQFAGGLSSTRLAQAINPLNILKNSTVRTAGGLAGVAQMAGIPIFTHIDPVTASKLAGGAIAATGAMRAVDGLMGSRNPVHEFVSRYRSTAQPPEAPGVRDYGDGYSHLVPEEARSDARAQAALQKVQTGQSAPAPVAPPAPGMGEQPRVTPPPSWVERGEHGRTTDMVPPEAAQALIADRALQKAQGQATASLGPFQAEAAGRVMELAMRDRLLAQAQAHQRAMGKPSPEDASPVPDTPRTTSERAMAAMLERRAREQPGATHGQFTEPEAPFGNSFIHRNVEITIPQDVRNAERYRIGAIVKQDAISRHIEDTMNMSVSEPTKTILANSDTELRTMRNREQARAFVERMLAQVPLDDRQIVRSRLMDEGFLGIWSKDRD